MRHVNCICIFESECTAPLEAADLALVPFSDNLRAYGQGFARVTAEGAVVRLCCQGKEGSHLALHLTPLTKAEDDDITKGHMSPVWGITLEAPPCLSPFWLSVAQSIPKEHFEALTETEAGAGQLCVRVTTVDATTKLAFQKRPGAAVGLGRLNKSSKPMKKTLDVPMVTNVSDVEAGTPLFLVL